MDVKQRLSILIHCETKVYSMPHFNLQGLRCKIVVLLINYYFLSIINPSMSATLKKYKMNRNLVYSKNVYIFHKTTW